MASSISTIQPLSSLPREMKSLPAPEMKSPPTLNLPREMTSPPVLNLPREMTSPPVLNLPLEIQPAISSEISPAVAFSDAELAVFHAVIYVLRTHPRLTEAEIYSAANYITSFYANSQEQGVMPPLTDSQLIMFLVYADQSGICKFALMFNEELDLAIKRRDEISFKNIITGPREMFIELYDNTFLNSEDREFIIRLVSREIFAMNLTFERLKRKIINLEPIDTRCLSETTMSQGHITPQGVHMTTLTSTCYNEVCVQDARILEDDLIRASMSQYEKAPGSVYTVDMHTGAPQVFCFETLDLIAAMTEEIPINPQTGQPFSAYSVEIIYQRFHKEIAMYQRYKQIKQIRAR